MRVRAVWRLIYHDLSLSLGAGKMGDAADPYCYSILHAQSRMSQINFGYDVRKNMTK